MTENIHSTVGRTLGRDSVQFPDWTLPVFLGLVAGVAAALFVSFHWTVAVFAAGIVVALAASENEIFLLAVIFLLPVNWVRSTGAVRDLTTPLRLLVIFGFFGGRLLRGTVNWRRLSASPLSWASGLLFGVMLTSVAIGPVGWQHDSFAQIYRLVSWIGFYFFALAWINSIRRMRRVLAALLGSLCMLGFYSVLQEAAGGYTRFWRLFNPRGPLSLPWNGRAPSLLAYSTSLAGCLGLLLPIALATWIVASGRLKKLGGCAFGMGLLSLFFAQSLGGFLALAFIIVLAILCFGKSWRRRIVLSGGLVAMAAALYVARRAINPAHFAVAAHTLIPDIMGRLLQYSAAWEIFLQHPLLGVGFGNFGAVSGAYLPNVSWMTSASLIASNLYLNLLAETGVIGFAAFLYVIVLGARKAIDQMRRKGWELGPVFAFGALGAAGAVLAHGVVDYLFFYCPQYGTLLWLLLALMVVNSGLYCHTTPARPRESYPMEHPRSRSE